jgi:hypothetical protein
MAIEKRPLAGTELTKLTKWLVFYERSVSFPLPFIDNSPAP